MLKGLALKNSNLPLIKDWRFWYDCEGCPYIHISSDTSMEIKTEPKSQLFSKTGTIKSIREEKNWCVHV